MTGRIARDLCWTNKGFPLSVKLRHGSPAHIGITWGMNNRPDFGRSSETQSHPIDMKITIIGESVHNSHLENINLRILAYLFAMYLVLL
jgi:hypothetical protein